MVLNKSRVIFPLKICSWITSIQNINYMKYIDKDCVLNNFYWTKGNDLCSRVNLLVMYMLCEVYVRCLCGACEVFVWCMWGVCVVYVRYIVRCFCSVCEVYVFNIMCYSSRMCFLFVWAVFSILRYVSSKYTSLTILWIGQWKEK